MNVDLDGFTLHSQPSRLADLSIPTKRTDLSVADDEFETIWVEIINTKAKNILYCYAYRHPYFNPVRFKEHFESILSQVSRGNKNIFLMET